MNACRKDKRLPNKYVYIIVVIFATSIAAFVCTRCVSMRVASQISDEDIPVIEHKVKMLGIQIQQRLETASELSYIWDSLVGASDISQLCGPGIVADVSMAADCNMWTSHKHVLVMAVIPRNQENNIAFLFYANGDYKVTKSSEMHSKSIDGCVLLKEISGSDTSL